MLGAHITGVLTRFAVRSPLADGVTLCLFEGERERRVPMRRESDDWIAELPGSLAGTRYGYRADGQWAPERGRWFDPAKLLVDPYALELDRRFAWDRRLATYGEDTAALVPKAIVPAALPDVPPTAPRFRRGGLIYELNVKGFTQDHPDVPDAQRGTIAALAHPAIIAHFHKLHVAAIELMPIVAWIDERHLAALGRANAWGYNPVAMMALDPGLCPGGVAELRQTVAALHAAGIGVILDLVFNHSGESDQEGGILSLRGLDDAAYAKAPDGALINDTGCGNTLNFGSPQVRALTVAALRHFVRHCGIDGFRFDLAPVLARSPGFDPHAPIFAQIVADPWLADRVLIAEPWDIGPGGYRLGQFPANWLEWNDRYRDDVRRFWRSGGTGSAGTAGALATRLAGSSDVFGSPTRSVNFVAAHDGFTLADTVAYAVKHNHANGEDNRDGSDDNHSWNHGCEGSSDDPAIVAARRADLKAMLGTLFASSGTIMITAGDEFGRSQHGNNNAYAQANATTWIDWSARDEDLEAHVAALAAWRATRLEWFARFPADGDWLTLGGAPMTVGDWEDAGGRGVTFASRDTAAPYRVTIDRSARSVDLGDL